MVFDYVAGKLDWLASDLPYEGELKETATLVEVADRAVLTCAPNEPCAGIQRRMEKEDRSFCAVVDDAGIVLGLVRRGAAHDNQARVEQVMENGPTTLRPHVTVPDAADFSRQQKLDPVLVTTSDGRLLGAIRSKDLQKTG